MSSEEEFYPAEEEAEPKVLDQEMAIASLQPEAESVTEIQTTHVVEGITQEIVVDVSPEGADSSQVIMDVEKAEQKEPEETQTQIQSITVQPDQLQESTVTEPEEATFTQVNS